MFQTPRTPEAWEAVAHKYNELWQFPNCIGAVDGKHVVMVAPPNAGSIFYNYKGTHSIILMGITDAEYKLLYVDVGRNGRFSDGGVFNRCTFAHAMDSDQLGLPPPKPLPGRTMPVPYVLVADDAFALRPYARFRVLRKPISLNADKTKKVVLACCVLHNYLMTTNKEKYAPASSFDKYNDNGEFIPGQWRRDVETEGGIVESMLSLERPRTEPADNAKDIQNEFKTYFMEEGELEWQYRMV